MVAEWLDFFYGFHRAKGYPGAPVHDAVAVAALIAPEILTIEELYVEVETAGRLLPRRDRRRLLPPARP